MILLLAAGLAAAWGLASALVPVVNAEAWAVVAATRTPGILPVSMIVLGLAVGQTAGKLALHTAARTGSSRLAARTVRREAGAMRRWGARLRDSLTTRRTGVPLVLLAASVGLPPLAAVSLASGAAGQRRLDFVVPCLIGRVVRFGALAAPVVALAR